MLSLVMEKLKLKSSVFKYSFEVLVLNLSIPYFHYILEGNIVLSTPLHLF